MTVLMSMRFYAKICYIFSPSVLYLDKSAKTRYNVSKRYITQRISMKKALLILLTSVILTSCIAHNGDHSETGSESVFVTDTESTTTEADTTTAEETTAIPETEAVPEPDKLSIVAVGDNLIHDSIYKSGEAYGYDSLYEEVAPIISAADLAIINQETIFTYGTSYSGYPRFLSPDEIGIAALNAGFDVFSSATNHTSDRGLQPMLDTFDFWKKHPEGVCVGMYETKDDYNDKVTIIERNNIKIALFNYTYGLNRYAPKWWMIDLLDESFKDRMERQFAYARENSDMIIVMAHWGKEYVYTPNAKQTKWAQYFADLGADLIIGTHPHVVQPVMELIGKDGNKTVCYYSLGNFISAQDTVARNVGGLARINVIKDESGTYIESYDMIPTTVHRENIKDVRAHKYSVVLLEDYTDERLDKNVKFSKYSIKDYWDCYNEAIASYPS